MIKCHGVKLLYQGFNNADKCTIETIQNHNEITTKLYTPTEFKLERTNRAKQVPQKHRVKLNQNCYREREQDLQKGYSNRTAADEGSST